MAPRTSASWGKSASPIRPAPCRRSRRHHDGQRPARLEPRPETQLIQAAYDALPPGGALIAVENIIDDDRRENVFGLMMSLNGDAFDFTGADYRGWCEDAGFTKVEILPLAGPAGAAIAYK